MSKIKNGGPAYPAVDIVPGVNYNSSTEIYYKGMTLRDWFAGQALVGLSIRREGECDADDAENAYRLADAMLKAREVNK